MEWMLEMMKTKERNTRTMAKLVSLLEERGHKVVQTKAGFNGRMVLGRKDGRTYKVSVSVPIENATWVETVVFRDSSTKKDGRIVSRTCWGDEEEEEADGSEDESDTHQDALRLKVDGSVRLAAIDNSNDSSELGEAADAVAKEIERLQAAMKESGFEME